jgi:hypothetical protein
MKRTVMGPCEHFSLAAPEGPATGQKTAVPGPEGPGTAEMLPC